jgi:hypothetical protein
MLSTLETTDNYRSKTFSEDIIVGSTASQVYTRFLQNTLDVHTERYCLQFTRLTLRGYEISWDAATLNFVNPTANTLFKVPAKLLQVFTH